MKKIVLIEDDSDLYALLKYNLEKEGFAVAGAQTVDDFLREYNPQRITKFADLEFDHSTAS